MLYMTKKLTFTATNAISFRIPKYSDKYFFCKFENQAEKNYIYFHFNRYMGMMISSFNGRKIYTKN